MKIFFFVCAVLTLVDEVFLAASGPAGVAAVHRFLQEQRVTAMSDLQWMEFDWLKAVLQPQGIPPLLLNKFLALARAACGLTPLPSPGHE